ncbi:MAG: transporter substrate-binding domain-containing protein, partial [Bacillota bacterium]|nr:transporter substrate-binding domain-containing protein [Bacillota bacterium]
MKKLLVIWVIMISVVSVLAAVCHAADSAIAWTEDELSFMQEHPVIRLGVDPEFVPFEFIDDDGEYKGITADYLALISAKTGLRFEVVQGLTWPEAYDRALAGDVDVLPAISLTDERLQHFLFSEPYYYFHRVIVTRDTDTGISDIADLSGRTVAVQRNSSHHSYLLSYPEINLSLYDSVETALAAIANGTEKAFVGNLATTDYLVRSSALTNLKFIAFEAEKRQALYLAVRRDWPQLVGIIDKVLDAITAEEQIAINNRWIEFESEIDFGPIVRTILIVGSFLAVVLAVSSYWIIRLRKEAVKRQMIQADLEKAKQAAEEANGFKSSFLARMSHEIRTPLNAISGMAWLLKKTDVTPTQSMYVDRITQASGNMLTIVNDILDFAKIEAGKVDLEITSFSMDQVVQSLVSITAYKFEEQGIVFRLERDAGVPNWFLGDPKRIEQILLNLLNNAAKFTSKGEVSLTISLQAQVNDPAHLSFTVR